MTPGSLCPDLADRVYSDPSCTVGQPTVVHVYTMQLINFFLVKPKSKYSVVDQEWFTLKSCRIWM
jgi:hypothetical protein